MEFRRFVPGAGLVLMTLAYGCASLVAPIVVPQRYQLWMEARYAELEREVETRIKDLAFASSADLVPLCDAYLGLKKYNKATACLNQLERNIHRGDVFWNHPGLPMTVQAQWRPAATASLSARLRMMRATISMEFGSYRRAVQEAQQALALLKEHPGPDWDRTLGTLTQSTLATLALAHALAGDRDTAGTYVARLQAQGPVSPGVDRPAYAVTAPYHLSLARIHAALGNYHRSSEALKRIDWTRWVGGGLLIPSSIPEIWLNTLRLPAAVLENRSLYETGSIGEAKIGYDRLLALPQLVQSGELYWLTLFDRGRIAEREQSLNDAIDFYRRAVDVIEQQRSTVNTEVNKIGFVGDKQAVYARLIATLVAAGRHAEAFEYAERAKSRALVDLLASKNDYAVANADSAQAVAALTQLANAEAAVRVQDDAGAAELDARRRRSIEIKERLRSSAPELASLVTVAGLPAREIQALLREDETLLEFYYHEGDAFAFVLTRNRLTAVKLEGAGLGSDVATFRGRLQAAGTIDHLDHARRLYRRLFSPIEALLAGPHLLVVPHGALHYLPFGALHSGQQHVIDRYGLRYLPSASVLTHLARRPRPAPTRLLAIANPDLGDPRFALRFAEQEARAIARLFSDARVILRKDATESAFRRLAGGFSHLHLAGHAEFDAAEPLTSGLRLAADVDTDGFLTLGEVYSLRLQADLVTLSACETGLGQVQNGDDVVGLTRGFLFAGANSVVASLWKVDDKATAALMTEFYASLQSRNKRDALRAAQLTTRQRFPHPFFWAAFQLTGLAD